MVGRDRRARRLRQTNFLATISLSRRSCAKGGGPPEKLERRLCQPQIFCSGDLRSPKTVGLLCRMPPLVRHACFSISRNNEPVSFAVLEHRVNPPRLFLWRTFEF